MRTHLDLFTGLGGFALAARWNGIETIQFVEIDQRCGEFLSRAWPGVPIHDDVRTFHYSDRPVFLLTGGVPCQPASRAGKQRGCSDDRWLWKEAVAMLGYANPTWAIFENPPGIGDVGLAGILSGVEAQGYQVRVFGVPACAVGSPQIRMRYWIVAHNTGARRIRAQESENGEQNCGSWGRLDSSNDNKSLLANAPRKQDDIGRDGDVAEAEGCRRGSDAAFGCSGEYVADAEAAAGISLQDGKEPESPAPDGRCYSDSWGSYVWLPCADGKVRRAPNDSFDVAHGLHRSLLGALGNSIVPQVAYQIINAIMEASNDDISESGEICDSVAEEGAPVFVAGGRCADRKPHPEERRTQGSAG